MTETKKLLLDTLRTLMSEFEGLESTCKTTNDTMLYAEQLEAVGGTDESLGGVKRAGYAIERAKQGIDRAVTAVNAFIQLVMKKVREKSRGMGFGR